MGRWTGTIDCIHVFIKQTAGAGLSVMLLLWNKDDGKDIEASNPIQSMPWKHYIGSPKYLKLFASDDDVKVWAVLCCTDAMWCVGRPSSPCTTMCTLLLSDVEWWPNKAMVLFSVSSAPQSRASSNWSTLQHTGSFPAWDFDKVTKNLPEEFSKMCELARDKLRVGWSLICSNSHLLRIHR